MSTISSLEFKDINTPKLFFEEVLGVKWNTSLKATSWGPPKLVSSKEGTLAKFYAPDKSDTLSNTNNSTSDKVVNFERLMQLMYYCILCICDTKDKEIFDNWDSFKMVLGKFIRGITNLEKLLKESKEETEIDSILKNVIEKEGKNKKDRVLKYLDKLKKQLIIWQGKVPSSNISTKPLTVKIPKIKTKKATSDGDNGAYDKCTAPGYGKYSYLASNDGGMLCVPKNERINIPPGTSEYVFFVSEDCTIDGKMFSFKRKLKNTTPLCDCLKPIAKELLKHKDKLNTDLAENLKTDTGDLWELTRFEGNFSACGFGGQNIAVYSACLATDKKTLLPFLIDEYGQKE